MILGSSLVVIEVELVEVVVGEEEVSMWMGSVSR